jgi:hypothetical protein
MFSIIINVVEVRLYKSEIKNIEFLMLAFCGSEWPTFYSFCNNVVDSITVTCSTNWK